MVEYKRIRVLIETSERSFRGFMFKPQKDDRFRLSDHLNAFDKQFISLADVEIAERGQHWRVGDKQDFVAIAINSITYVTPLEDE